MGSRIGSRFGVQKGGPKGGSTFFQHQFTFYLSGQFLQIVKISLACYQSRRAIPVLTEENSPSLSPVIVKVVIALKL